VQETGDGVELGSGGGNRREGRGVKERVRSSKQDERIGWGGRQGGEVNEELGRREKEGAGVEGGRV